MPSLAYFVFGPLLLLVAIICADATAEGHMRRSGKAAASYLVCGLCGILGSRRWFPGGSRQPHLKAQSGFVLLLLARPAPVPATRSACRVAREGVTPTSDAVAEISCACRI